MGYKDSSSFTLLELVVVLCLILFLVTYTIPSFDFYKGLVLRRELQKIEALCYYLQQRAIVTGITQKMLIDPVKNNYSFSKNGQKIDFQLTNPLTFGFINGVMGPPAQPTASIGQVATFSFENGLFVINFVSNGRISSGSLYFVDKQKKVMGALTCAVSQVSYIRVYLFSTGQWELLL